ncbi:glucosaminidase domain-containing protein [Flavobacterium soyangense]|uniref:Peptidoglycan hydrolase n=1 Tax=Flavobacterium soyangense TaxID=2023265 RepID=A0A930U7E1_9FLAO|nr:glucosaminidase domain-containing protein [Flavobacterium soyangense]MBF2708141.1 glucosaminidase domain-containing protein [Flavobacterium soyangense]
MIRKSVFLLLVLFFVSCNTNKSVIQTTRKGSKPYASVVKTVRKPVVKEPVENKSTAKPDQNYNQNTVILEATTRVKVTNEMILAYIETYKEVAQSNMGKYGIPASIILGQAILESGAGTGPLSVQANNHFGIKCHKDWLGQTIKYDDDSIDECFRKYYNAPDSFRDHALFLRSGVRYSKLFNLNKTDYKAWAKGLKDAGYATDPQYPTKLIGLIEKFQLYKYDIGNLGKIQETETEITKIPTETERYVVVKGDTLYSISKKYNIPIEDLKKQNNLFDNAISIGQPILIIK